MLGMFNKKPEPTDEEVARNRAQFKETLGVVVGAGFAFATALSPETAEAQTNPGTREVQKNDLVNLVLELNNEIVPLIPNMKNRNIATSLNKALEEIVNDAQRTSKLNEWTTPTGADGLVRHELYALRRRIEALKEDLGAAAVVENGFTKIHNKIVEAYTRIEKYKF